MVWANKFIGVLFLLKSFQLPDIPSEDNRHLWPFSFDSMLREELTVINSKLKVQPLTQKDQRRIVMTCKSWLFVFTDGPVLFENNDCFMINLITKLSKHAVFLSIFTENIFIQIDKISDNFVVVLSVHDILIVFAEVVDVLEIDALKEALLV